MPVDEKNNTPERKDPAAYRVRIPAELFLTKTVDTRIEAIEARDLMTMRSWHLANTFALKAIQALAAAQLAYNASRRPRGLSRLLVALGLKAKPSYVSFNFTFNPELVDDHVRFAGILGNVIDASVEWGPANLISAPVPPEFFKSFDEEYSETAYAIYETLTEDTALAYARLTGVMNATQEQLAYIIQNTFQQEKMAWGAVGDRPIEQSDAVLELVIADTTGRAVPTNNDEALARFVEGNDKTITNLRAMVEAERELLDAAVKAREESADLTDRLVKAAKASYSE